MNNKKLANRILIFLFFSFSIITLFRIFVFDNFIVELLGFTIEAALVGGIADWFAITALFKEPLGFSWHTALIPKNREKVIEAVSNMVEGELLSYKFIESKVEEIHIVNLLISYVENNNTKNSIDKLIEKYGQDILAKFDTNKIAEYIEEFLKDKLKNVDISLKIKKVFEWAIQNGEYERFLEAIVNGLIIAVKKDSTKEEIYKIINDEVQKSKNKTKGFKRMFFEVALDIAEGTNSVNIRDAANSMQKELIEILTNMKDKKHPMHKRLDQIFKEAAQKMETDDSVSNSIEIWKEEIISRIYLKDELEKLINGVIKITDKAPSEVETYSEEVSISDNSPVIQWLIAQVNKYWNNFKQDEKIKNWLEGYIKENLMKVIKAEHHLLGMMVKETLGTFTNEALNEFIESKTGNDLHWIRINGSIVGAVVGVIIYLFVNLFYGPIIVPIIRGWF